MIFIVGEMIQSSFQVAVDCLMRVGTELASFVYLTCVGLGGGESIGDRCKKKCYDPRN